MSILIRSVIVAVLGMAGFAVSYATGVLTRLGQSVEQQVLDSSYYAETSPVLKLVSIPNLAIALGVVVLVGLIRRAWADLLVAAAVIAASNVLGQLLKYEVLKRPALILDSTNTFPSGHTIAFCSALFALLIVLGPAMRAVVLPLAAATICVAGGQLIVFGWHRPSDVIGGVCLVAGVAGTAHALRFASKPRATVGGGPPVSGATKLVYGLLLAVAGAAGVAAAGIAALHWFQILDGVGLSVTVMATSGVVAAACLATVFVSWMLPIAKR